VSELSQAVSLLKVEGAHATPQDDLVAHEEPLELQVDGQSLAVLMRTRGHDEELGLGFLRTEGLIQSLADLESIRHCTTVPSPEAEDNVLQIRFARPFDHAKVRRHFFATSSCGVCGKATIENALKVSAPVQSEVRVSREVLRALPDALRAGQVAFEETGGLHAAALFDAEGRLRVLREDVGRHNAVDKVVGWALRTDAPTRDGVLMVSGRLSFELVQKCVAARIPVLAGVSAPTSLAVEMAEALGVTLVGFLRGGSMNVYAHARRLTPGAATPGTSARRG
jgi:FdhD protein